MYENEEDWALHHTFFVQSQRKINGNNLQWKMTKTAKGSDLFCVNSSYELTPNDTGGTDICRKMYSYKKLGQGGPDFSKFLPNGALTENDNIVKLCNEM